MKTQVIEIIDANFAVGSNGLAIKLSDKSILEMASGEGVRIVSAAGTPYLEYKSAGKEHRAKIVTANDLRALMGRVTHTTEHRTKTVDLMTALAMDEKDLSTEALVGAFSQVQESQKTQLNKQITYTKRVATLSVEDKTRMIGTIPPMFRESAELVVTGISDYVAEEDEGGPLKTMTTTTTTKQYDTDKDDDPADVPASPFTPPSDDDVKEARKTLLRSLKHKLKTEKNADKRKKLQRQIEDVGADADAEGDADPGSLGEIGDEDDDYDNVDPGENDATTK